MARMVRPSVGVANIGQTDRHAYIESNYSRAAGRVSQDQP